MDSLRAEIVHELVVSLPYITLSLQLQECLESITLHFYSTLLYLFIPTIHKPILAQNFYDCNLLAKHIC